MRKLFFVISIFLCLTSSAQVPGLSNLVPYVFGNGLLNGAISVWPLNGDANDAHGSYNGTIYNATYEPSGKLGGCYYCRPANNGYIQGAFSGGDEYTISAWVKLNTGTVTSRGIAGYTNSTGHRREIGFGNQSGNLTFRIFGINNFYDSQSISSYAGDGNWHLFVGIINSSGTPYFYLDNNALTQSNSNSFTTTYTADFFRIGQILSSTSSTYSLDGYIDQTAIWNRALTTDELTALYNSGNGIYYIDFTAFIKPLYQRLIPLKYDQDFETPLKIAS